MTADAPDLAPLLLTWAVLLLIGAGVYVWYGAMLAKVLTRLGAEGWKAWVPVLNEAEILRLGGVPGWSVVFYVLPVVQLYGLYLKAVATSRINAHFGRGPAVTVLAILVPPVWAAVLAHGQGATDPALQERIAPSMTARSGYAFAVSTPPDQEPQALDASDIPPLVQPPEPPRPVGFPPLAPPTAPSAPPPAPPPPAPPVLPPPPAAAPAPRPIVPPPGIITPPPVSAPPVVAPPPAAPPAQPWVPLDMPAVDELDRTVVVDRRPAVPWELLIDGGPGFRLTAPSVILGRRPAGAGAGRQEIAVPDSTRTLSKVHARLDLADGVWTITDLDATNGVVVIEPDGTENLLDPGASAPLTERFVLGKVAMRVAPADPSAGR